MITRSKLTPPRLPRRTLQRPRVAARLADALNHRLTVVHAEAGYGKSTALAALAAEHPPTAWYQLTADDAEPLVFVEHLLYSLRLTLPALSVVPEATLETSNNAAGEARRTAAIAALADELHRAAPAPLLLILDDAHHIAHAPLILTLLNHLLERSPHTLHTVLATRLPVPLPSLSTWRLRGEVLEIGRDALAFTADEVAALFARHYEAALTPQQAAQLTEQTEGWAIALPLAWQSRSASQPPLPTTADDLFNYLAQEVLAQQPPEVVRFLQHTAVLRELSPEICDCVTQRNDSAARLRTLLDAGLFLVNLGDGHARYHPLFQQFLLHRQTPAARQAIHRQAAACLAAQGRAEESLHHLLAAAAWDDVARTLRPLGQEMVRAGRLDTLAAAIHTLPPDVLERHPPLLAYLGDVARLHSRFDEALGWYRQAETHSRVLNDVSSLGQALRGQARVYLDTVNATQAEHLLQEALRVSEGEQDRQSRIRLLELLAENRLNLGRLEDAERFQTQAAALRQEVSSEAELAVRVLMRTGRLAEARAILEVRAEAERQAPVLRPRAHRETSLLLSLLMSFQGDADGALHTALEGAARGRALQSPFITAVGAMRQGHARLLDEAADSTEEAISCFRRAITIADELAVPRLKVEAFWGLCHAHGFSGNLPAAEAAATQGVAIAQQTGDEWVTALIRLALGGSYLLAGRHEEAARLLAEASAAFAECSDTFGEAATRLWQCLLWQAAGDAGRLERGLDDLLRAARDHGYDWLFLRNTLLGPPEPRQAIPLLLHARQQERWRPYVSSLLHRLDLDHVELHPGYQLRVQTLGTFRVWRGADEIAPTEWRRDKARQLFQLLLTRRKRLLERDQIVELLWPGLPPDAAERDFKVALSTLYRVLEPDLPPRAPSAYVLRESTLYGLRAGADVTLDATRFEEALIAADHRAARNDPAWLEAAAQALAGYTGDFLQDYPYDEWCSEERERLLGLYLHAADQLAATLAAHGRWQEVIDLCQAILRRDECWEQAYRLTMQAQAALGNRAQALRTYARCVERLQAELDVLPSPATAALAEQIRRG